VEFVVIFWGIMAVLIFLQVFAILYFIKDGGKISVYGSYSEEAVKKAKIIITAIKERKIKKHIITNSAPKYDSRETLPQYKIFLSTELMKDISEIKEEIYNG